MRLYPAIFLAVSCLSSPFCFAVESDGPTEIKVTCEKLMETGAQLSADIQQALEKFPHGQTSIQLPADSENTPPDPNSDFEKEKERFSKNFAQAQSVASLVSFRHLPMTLTQDREDGIDYSAHLDWLALVGQPVVAYRDTMSHVFPETGGRATAKIITRQFLAGVVERVSHEDHITPTLQNRDGFWKYPFTRIQVRNLDGRLEELVFSAKGYYLPAFKLWTLTDKKSDEEILRKTMEMSGLEGHIETAFGPPLTKEDYDMAWAAVETALSVPPSYGGTAVIKILLGRQVRNGPSFTHFGVARGKKRYNELALKKFVGPLFTFMSTAEVLGPDVGHEDRDNYDNWAPDWISVTKRTELAKVLRKIWNDLHEEKGGGVMEVIPAKAPPKNSVNLTRENVLPGVFVVVQEAIGLVKTAEAMKAFPVFKREEGDSSFSIRPGEKLEVVSKIHKSASSNMVRVRDPKTGLEGEAFWGSLKISTKLEKPN